MSEMSVKLVPESERTSPFLRLHPIEVRGVGMPGQVHSLTVAEARELLEALQRCLDGGALGGFTRLWREP